MCSARLNSTHRTVPAYTFRGVDVKQHSSKYPGPGEYQPLRGITASRPCTAPQAMKFRFRAPADGDQTPSPAAYEPTYPLKMYKGECSKCTIKTRCAALCTLRL